MGIILLQHVNVEGLIGGKMQDSELRAHLEKLSGWVLNKGRLEKTFLFSNFARAAVFFNKMVNPIEENENYPQITIIYNRVLVSLMTPEAGKLTEKDFTLAKSFDELL